MNPWLIVAIGVMTLGLRGAFVLAGPPRWEARLQPYLRRLPPAVLTALAVSSLSVHASKPDAVLRLLAAGVGLLVALRTRSLLATLVAGLLALGLLRAAG